MRKLNPRQQRFVEEYLVDLNATQAAIRAGYAVKRADATAHNLLRNIEIQSSIQQAIEDRSKRTGITQDLTIREIGRLAYSDIRKLFDEHGNLKPIHQLDDDTAAAISSVKIKTGGGDEVEYVKEIKFWDKNSALDKLGRHQNLFTNVVKVDVAGAHVHKILDNDERAELKRAQLLKELSDEVD